jgi:hypothetical protein
MSALGSPDQPLLPAAAAAAALAADSALSAAVSAAVSAAFTAVGVLPDFDKGLGTELLRPGWEMLMPFDAGSG